MKKGILIFAHNSREVDYARLSIISGGLAKKYLNVPVSLVTDTTTIEWLKESNMFDLANSIFEHIIEVGRPATDNLRRLSDGEHYKTVPFINANRCSAWDVTPYDRTLLIDSDFLIFSDILGEYWNYDSDFLISSAMNDICGDRLGVLDKWTADEGLPLMWATTIMFTKNDNSRLYFDLVSHIKQNYQLYADIYRFDSRIFRNDIAFSIATHILNGFVTGKVQYLPDILTAQDKDLIIKINNQGIRILANSSQHIVGNFFNRDIHIMNKQSLIRCYDDLIKLI